MSYNQDMKNYNDLKILFITDIHQNIDAVRKIDFSLFDACFCGGDLLDPSNPDISIAKAIIDLLPKKTLIVPGNCDKDQVLIMYMKEKLKFIHKELTSLSDIPVLGIGYSRDLKDDMKVYRAYFQEDDKRVYSFIENNSINSFILDFCGIKIEEDNTIKYLSEKEALEKAEKFINKFVAFSENEIASLFSGIKGIDGGIILTHSPSYGTLDKLNGLPNIGSLAIKEGIIKTNPALVLCGHFHELQGKSKINNSIIFNPGALKDGCYGVIEFGNRGIKLISKKL